MRVLIADHVPPDAAADSHTKGLAESLARAGAEVRLLVSTDDKSTASSLARLPNEQFAAYRDGLRQRLDAAVDAFQPHVAHAQQIGIWGQLLVEAGVPYVLTACGRDFTALDFDPRLAELAEQAAENAGRILVSNETLAQEVRRRYPELDDRVIVLPELGIAADSALLLGFAAKIQAIYDGVVQERLGRQPLN